MDSNQIKRVPRTLEEFEAIRGDLSDKELDAFINGEDIALQATKPVIAKPDYKALVEKPSTLAVGPFDTGIPISSGVNQFLAGMGLEFMRPVQGLQEMAVGAFGSKEELEAFNREKANRRLVEDALMSKWPAKAGSLAGNIVVAAAAPARLPAQVALASGLGFLQPTQGEVTGAQPLTRAVQAATEGGTTAAVGKAVGLIGRGIGAATNRFTPEGREALRLDQAARRLGINRNVGGLDPSSPLNAFETNLPGYARTVEDQVKAFSQSAREVKDIPSLSGRSMATRTLEGEKIRSAIEEAGQNLQGVGSSLWKDLDSFIVQNNIAPVAAKKSQTRLSEVIQRYTPTDKKGVLKIDKNPVIQRINEYDPDAAKILLQFQAAGKTGPQVPFADMHKVQSAVGKALGRAEKDASAPGASMADRQTRTELKNLYGSLMADVDSWGTKNPSAKAMFDEARTFWRDVVVPGTLTNKVYSKASKGIYGMNPRGYSEASQLYSDVVKNPRAIQDLYPYMSQTGRDLTDTLRTMPDVARALTTNTPHPPAPGMGTLTTTAGMLVGSPLQLMKGALSHLPGIQRAATSTPAKKMYFSRDVTQNTPLGRLSFGLAQGPQESLEERVQALRVGKQ